MRFNFVIFILGYGIWSTLGSFISRTDRLLNGLSKDDLKSDKKPEFDPYVDNGGTIAAIAGPDFVVIAADNRLSDSYVIKSRSIPRLFEITKGAVYSASGCWSDVDALGRLLRREAEKYEWESDSPLDCSMLAHFLAHTLYGRRGFPFFSFCILGGFDKQGRPGLYKYDAIGSHEKVAVACAGKGEQMIQPLLDELSNLDEDDGLWTLSTQEDSFVSSKRFVQVTEEQAISILRKGFRAAAEREISIGDGFDLCVIAKDKESGDLKIRRMHFPLPKH